MLLKLVVNEPVSLPALKMIVPRSLDIENNGGKSAKTVTEDPPPTKFLEVFPSGGLLFQPGPAVMNGSVTAAPKTESLPVLI